MTTITKLENGLSYEWESFEEWQADLPKLKQDRPSFYREFTEGQGYTGERWLGVSGGFNGFIHAVEHGHEGLLRTVEAMMKGVELELPVYPSRVTERKRKRLRCDQGDSIDMQRVWSGQLDTAWTATRRVNKLVPNMRRITLAVDLATSATVTPEEALWRAALATMLCDSLVKAGRVFEVWAIKSLSRAFESSNDNVWLGWNVKKTNDPLIPERMAAMMSVGMCRAVGFLGLGMGKLTPNGGMGCPMYRELPATLRERQAQGEVVLRITGCRSREQMIQEYKRAWAEIEAAQSDDTVAA